MLEKERKIVIYLSKIAKTREETVFLFLSKNAKNVFIFNFFKEISSFVLLVRAAQCLGIRSGIGGQRTFHIFTLSFFLSFFLSCFIFLLSKALSSQRLLCLRFCCLFFGCKSHVMYAFFGWSLACIK